MRQICVIICVRNNFRENLNIYLFFYCTDFIFLFIYMQIIQWKRNIYENYLYYVELVNFAHLKRTSCSRMTIIIIKSKFMGIYPRERAQKRAHLHTFHSSLNMCNSLISAQIQILCKYLFQIYFYVNIIF